MFEVLQYATSGFWVFVGCSILFSSAVKGVVCLVVAIRGAPVTNITNKYAGSKP